MFLGWFDADKTIKASQKMRDAINRYKEKFGSAPEVCLTSVVDANEIISMATDLHLLDKLDVDVRGVAFIPRYTFYVGVEDKPDEYMGG